MSRSEAPQKIEVDNNYRLIAHVIIIRNLSIIRES